MNSLLILDDDAATFQKEVELCDLPELKILCADNPEEARAYLAEAQIILGRPDYVAEVLPEAKNLQWVQSTWAGIEPLCAPGLRTDYLLTGVKDVFGPLMSEYVFGYILARERSILATHANQQKRNWDPIAYRGLEGLTIGLVGLGSIGRHVAATAKHFGMSVLGMKRTPGDIDNIDRLFLPSDGAEFFPQLDYLVLILPNTSTTRDFITRTELALMKDSAVLINVGRGRTVNQPDLESALRNKRIGGAILDVFAEEPLPADSTLWEMENVVVTPHNSAFSFPRQVSAIFCENYRRFLRGGQLDHVVDLERGY